MIEDLAIASLIIVIMWLFIWFIMRPLAMGMTNGIEQIYQSRIKTIKEVIV